MGPPLEDLQLWARLPRDCEIIPPEGQGPEYHRPVILRVSLRWGVGWCFRSGTPRQQLRRGLLGSGRGGAVGVSVTFASRQDLSWPKTIHHNIAS